MPHRCRCCTSIKTCPAHVTGGHTHAHHRAKPRTQLQTAVRQASAKQGAHRSMARSAHHQCCGAAARRPPSCTARRFHCHGRARRQCTLTMAVQADLLAVMKLQLTQTLVCLRRLVQCSTVCLSDSGVIGRRKIRAARLHLGVVSQRRLRRRSAGFWTAAVRGRSLRPVAQVTISVFGHRHTRPCHRQAYHTAAMAAMRSMAVQDSILVRMA